MFLGLSLNGRGSVTSIWYSVASVHPISLSSSAKTPWNLVRRSKAFSLFSDVQDSNPNRSNFSKSFSLHPSVDSCWALLSFHQSRASRVPGNNIFSGIILVETVQPMGVPFLITTGWSFILYKATWTFWLPQSYLAWLGHKCSSLGSGGSPLIKGSVATFIFVLNNTRDVQPLIILLALGGITTVLTACITSLMSSKSCIPLLE